MHNSQVSSSSYYIQTDETFNKLYPPDIQVLSRQHWTSLHIVRCATEFLCSKSGSKILDIGSGVGKFCLTGAMYAPNAHFYGVEQRAYLVDHANIAKQKMGIKNASFIVGNFVHTNLQQFNHFYFFNSFFENLDNLGRIDEQIAFSESLYQYYVRHLYNGLKEMPSGTKIVTYHTFCNEVPREYKLVDSLEAGELNFWVRRQFIFDHSI